MTALNLNALTANTPSTSGSYTFSVTRDQIIRQAMLDIGALDPYEYPTTSEITDCAFKLNMMVKSWMGNTDFAPGLKVWTRKRGELFLQSQQYTYQLGATSADHWVDNTTGLAFPQLYGVTTLTAAAAKNATVLQVAAVSQYNIGDQIGILSGNSIIWSTVTAFAAGSPNTVTIAAPGLSAAAALGAYVWNYTTTGVRPITILTAVLRDIYANDTPLRVLNLEQYEALPTKTSVNSVGDPTAIFYEPRFTTQNPNGRIFLDVGSPADVTKYIHCVYLAPVQDFVNPGDAPDYPQEWYRPLVLGHGKDIAGMFDCAWTQDLEDNLQESLSIARQGNPATSAQYFEVNGDDPA